jgi:hypothetical protein
MHPEADGHGKNGSVLPMRGLKSLIVLSESVAEVQPIYTHAPSESHVPTETAKGTSVVASRNRR